MAYRKDPDLEFLQFCDNEDLEILVDYLIKDESYLSKIHNYVAGKNEQTEEHTVRGRFRKIINDSDDWTKRVTSFRWTGGLVSEERFQNCNGNYQQIWDLIAGELQLFGADTLVTTFYRWGEGVFYREILLDVSDHLKVEFDKKSETFKIENALLLKLFKDTEEMLEKMDEKEKEKFCKKMLEDMTEEEKKEYAKSANIDFINLSSVTMMATLQMFIRMGGFSSYQIAVIVANSVAKSLLGRGLSFAGNAALTRYMAIFAGPVGWAISALLTLPMLSGPAYRVTVPSVIQIAYMRQKYKNKSPF